jgi:hypothetical protein
MSAHPLRSFDSNGARCGPKYEKNNYQLPKSNTISNRLRQHARIIRDTCPKSTLPIDSATSRRRTVIKRYYADVYFYVCRQCKKQAVGKIYFGVFQKAEIGAAKKAGAFTYQCPNPACRATYRSDHLLTSGEVMEVPEDEARSNGLVYESAGSA